MQSDARVPVLMVVVLEERVTERPGCGDVGEALPVGESQFKTLKYSPTFPKLTLHADS